MSVLQRLCDVSDTGRGRQAVALLIAVLAGLVPSSGGHCPSRCLCEVEDGDQVAVTCAGTSVTGVPGDLPWDTAKLYFSKTALQNLSSSAFHNLSLLKEIYIKDDIHLNLIEPHCFDGLDKLIILSFHGCDSLQTISKGVLGHFEMLDTLKIYRSGLTQVPDFSMFSTNTSSIDGVMVLIDLSENHITEILTGAFKGVKMYKLILRQNWLKAIHKRAFAEAQISELNLGSNPDLADLSETSFQDIQDLSFLDLSGSKIWWLPTTGLADIKILLLENTPSLKTFPSVLQFRKIEEAKLTYPHHCCAFQNPEKQDPMKWKQHEEFQERIRKKCASTISPLLSTPLSLNNQEMHIPLGYKARQQRKLASNFQHNGHFLFPDKPENGAVSEAKCLNTNDSASSCIEFHSSVFGGTGLNSRKSNDFGGIVPPVKDRDSFATVRPNLTIAGIFHPQTSIAFNATNSYFINCGQVIKDYQKVVCSPKPDAFNPCEDIMGYEWLRIFVWLILLAAMLGNIVVILVLLVSKGQLTVSKFLMCNLAFADFLMGLYLMILALIDIRTLGEYFNYAVLWQTKGGCQAAGFLTIFSSELSVYTLSIITLERWYAISHAIHLTKRLKIRQAAGIMTLGWGFALIVALLPLFGISSYGTVSICLPMDVDTYFGLGYVIALMVLNGIAFMIICACYISMYLKVRGSESAAHNSDATIAKRMALLVFTNFACWAPIAFFGLTATAGMPLINITNSKILLVFFYPLNSCANPFLYAILTRQFHKDFFLILSRYGLCTKQANKYKISVSDRSLSHTPQSGMALHHVNHHPSDGSILTQYTERESKFSTGGSVSKVTANVLISPRFSPKHSPLATKKVPMSNFCSNVFGKLQGTHTRSTVPKCNRPEIPKQDVKLKCSDVERSHVGEHPFVSNTKDDTEYVTLQPWIRSVSDYAVVYQLLEDEKPCEETAFSNNTETSFVSSPYHSEQQQLPDQCQLSEMTKFDSQAADSSDRLNQLLDKQRMGMSSYQQANHESKNETDALLVLQLSEQ